MSDVSYDTLNSYCDRSIFNASCNYDSGTKNSITGDLEFNYYGYKVDWAAYLFVVLFTLITRKCRVKFHQPRYLWLFH